VTCSSCCLLSHGLHVHQVVDYLSDAGSVVLIRDLNANGETVRVRRGHWHWRSDAVTSVACSLRGQQCVLYRRVLRVASSSYGPLVFVIKTLCLLRARNWTSVSWT
jgi:hypothetical protein